MFAHAAASVAGHVTVPAAASSRAPRSRASSSGATSRPARQTRRAGTAVTALDLNVVELAQVAVDDDLIPNLAIAASLVSAGGPGSPSARHRVSRASAVRRRVLAGGERIR